MVLAFCESIFGVVLRLMNELSPSVPHCRDVTEQPISDVKANAKNRVLRFFTRGLFVGGCVFDPSMPDRHRFYFFFCSSRLQSLHPLRYANRVRRRAARVLVFAQFSLNCSPAAPCRAFWSLRSLVAGVAVANLPVFFAHWGPVRQYSIK